MSDTVPTAGIYAEDLAAAAQAAAEHYADLLAKQREEYIADLQTKQVSVWWWNKRTFTKDEAEASWDASLWYRDNHDHQRHAVRLQKIAQTSAIHDIRLPQADILFLRRWLNGATDAEG